MFINECATLRNNVLHITTLFNDFFGKVMNFAGELMKY